jgi:membrane protease YdiL (CAAX protease family)
MALPEPYALPHPGPPPEPPELPEGAPRPRKARGGWRRVPAPWPAWTAPVALLVGFTATFVGGAVIIAAAAVGGADFEDPPPGVLIASTVFQDVALIGSAWIFARIKSAATPWHFGFRPPRVWISVGLVVAGYFVFLMLTGIWIAVMDGLGVDVDSDNDLPGELGAEDSVVALIAVGLLVTVVAPIAEEVFFRGFFFTALRNWKGVPLATLLTGLVFGGIHVGSSPAVFLVPLAIFGAVLCLVYWLADSLLPCIVLHAINNSVAFGVSQDWGWQIPLVILGSMVGCGAVGLPLPRRAPRPQPA